MISAASAGGALSRYLVTGSTGLDTCCASTDCGLGPMNGGRPASIS